MKSLLAVTMRELRERRLLLAVAFAAGAVPLVLPYAGVAGRLDRLLIGAVLAFALTLATALLTGASAIGRDLAEGRLGFFFARPLSAGAIWGGKMLAALVLTLGVLALSGAALPALGEVGRPASRPVVAAWLVLGLAAIIGLAHAVSVGYRSRSPWFLADLALAVMAAAWTTHIVLRILSHALMPPVVPMVATAASALMLAGAAQVAIGRTDLQRGHRVMSLVLWTTLLAGLAGFEVYTRQLLNPAWESLVWLDQVEAAPAGNWSAVHGRARGRAGVHWLFLADAAEGRRLLIGGADRRVLVFAPDGRRAAWATYSGLVEPTDLSVMDLDDVQPRPRPLDLASDDTANTAPVAFSPDGERLLALAPQRAYVISVDGRRAPLRVALPPWPAKQAAFLGGDRLRVFSSASAGAWTGTLYLLDVDLSAGVAHEAGRIDTRGNAWVRVSPDGARLLVLDRPDRQPSLTLHAADGTFQAVLVDRGTATSVQADFLADGRIAVLQNDVVTRLRLFSAAGAAGQTVTLSDRPVGTRLGGEVAPGRLAVGLALDSPAGETVIVDCGAGRVQERRAGLTPVATSWFFVRDAASARPAPGSLAARLFQDASGDIVALETGGEPPRVIFRAGR